MRYYSTSQYRVYRSKKNRFEWSTNVKFYEDRMGLKLISKDLLSKYDNLRAEISAIRLVVNEIYINDVLSIIKYITSDNNNKNNYKH